jgi:hypothetical protein
VIFLGSKQGGKKNLDQMADGIFRVNLPLFYSRIQFSFSVVVPKYLDLSLCPVFKRFFTCVISGFRRGVN